MLSVALLSQTKKSEYASQAPALLCTLKVQSLSKLNVSNLNLIFGFGYKIW